MHLQVSQRRLVFILCAFDVKNRVASSPVSDLQCESKNPLRFSDIFPKRMGIFNQFFTHLLYVPFYARIQIFIQLSPTLTTLCHTNRNHPTNFCISLEV